MRFVKCKIRDLAEARGKELVADTVKLWRHMPSADVEDVADGGVMLVFLTEVHPTSGTFGPLRQTLAVLELRVEDVDRTSPNLYA